MKPSLIGANSGMLWPTQPWVAGRFSNREGGLFSVCGQSNGEGNADLNLGFTKEDDPSVVTANRHRFLADVAPGLTLDNLVTMRQVHGSVVRVVSRTDAPFMDGVGRAVIEADGLATDEPGLLLGVMTADCVPILLADERNHAVAALHAGWRGTLAGIAAEGVRTMQREFGSNPADIVAVIGPAILQCCFAVGDEVYQSFSREYAYGDGLFTRRPDGQLHMDLHAANRRQLQDAGLHPVSIQCIDDCTACARLPDGRRKYFSHRAEKGVTGRMMSVIGLRDEA